MKTIDFIKCTNCDSYASIIEDTRYNGLRGVCLNCGGNWPES